MAEWRAIPGFPDYEASSEGAIRRRTAPKRNRLYPITGFCDPRGYIMVGIKNAVGQLKNVQVHKLVCLAFHGLPPSPAHQVAHNDGSRGNNSSLNLRWATPKENTADKILHGTSQRGEKNPIAKLSEAAIPEIFRLANAGEMQRSIARRYGVHQRQIFNVLHKRTWAHVSEAQCLQYARSTPLFADART